MANEEHPPVHAIVYGEAGSGKSSFIATFPKPLLVFNFDAINKEAPYLRKATGGTQLVTDERGTPVNQCFNKKGELAIQVEYYLDQDPTRPEAYQRFIKRLVALTADLEAWKTLALDSVTLFEIAARKMQQYYLNPTSKDPRQWYAGSTEQLEEVLMIRFGSLPMNVVIACHVDEDKDEAHGFFVRNPAAPGRMRKRLSAGYSEMYRSYVQRDEEGTHYLLQTRADNLWNATSSFIEAPNPCPPIYGALWMGR